MKKFFSFVLVLVLWVMFSGDASACGKGRFHLFHRGQSSSCGGCSTCGSATKATATAPVTTGSNCPSGTCPTKSVAGSAGHLFGTVVSKPFEAVQSFRAGMRSGATGATCPNCK